jgi:hypothetical protein
MVRLHGQFAESKTDAGRVFTRTLPDFNLAEFFKDFFLVRYGNARAVIPDGKQHPILLWFHTNGNRTIDSRELDCVVQEIDDDTQKDIMIG